MCGMVNKCKLTSLFLLHILSFLLTKVKTLLHVNFLQSDAYGDDLWLAVELRHKKKF